MRYSAVDIKGIKIFYREAGDADKPTMVLFHGFPSSSHMYRDLMSELKDRFHMIAPDYPGFGQSESPARAVFQYTFEHITDLMEAFLEELGIESFLMYVFDYGAPIGFRIANRHPEWIKGIISQNGNIYEEGLGKKWEARRKYWEHPTLELRESFKSAFAKDTVIGQYKFGIKENSVSPDGYSLDLYYASVIREYEEIQSDLIFDYQTNVALYPVFQHYLREHQPRLLAIWGKNDPSFIPAGAEAFLRDVPEAVVEFVDSGHFALESCCDEIAEKIREVF